AATAVATTTASAPATSTTSSTTATAGLSSPASTVVSRLPFLVLVTDGEPTVGQQDTAALLAMAAGANRAKARIFTFGVGYDVRVPLLDGLAEASGGRRDYVAPNENLELVLSRFFRKVAQP